VVRFEGHVRGEAERGEADRLHQRRDQAAGTDSMKLPFPPKTFRGKFSSTNLGQNCQKHNIYKLQWLLWATVLDLKLEKSCKKSWLSTQT
jgi:hypothetical protein